LKKILIRKGVRTGISWALAGVTCGLSVGLDALFDLSDVADIGDILDMADMADAVGNSVDAMDVLDADIIDFDLTDIDDVNIDDAGDGDNLLADSYNISFQGAPNDGSYMRTDKDVSIQVAGGSNKGSFDVYLHHGDKYIDFQDHWIKIQGKTRFHLNGNDYIIK
jgi:hypothetical protein